MLLEEIMSNFICRIFGWPVEKQPKSSKRNFYEHSEREIIKKACQFQKRKKYNKTDYQNLLNQYLDGYKNITYAEYISLLSHDNDDNNRYLLIRHDVDHDCETALKMAEWEAEREIKATYCLLHTAWYYGPLVGKKYQHSKELVKCATRLHELGHEINFHNNLVVMGLTEGLNPAEVLNNELSFFRDELGIPVSGTSTHGDRLCREINFRNWEMFLECCDDRFGGPRSIEYAGSKGCEQRVELGKYSMKDFGLTYEAYDLPFDVYHTDSGGDLISRDNIDGRKVIRDKRGKEHLVGLLTHPIWWQF